MIKKIIPVLFLLPTLGFAEVKQKGFFVGIDYTKTDVTLDYQTTGATAYNSYGISDKDSIVAFKAGYQYYSTRVYLRYYTFKDNDTKRDKFLIKGKAYEFNADYIPVFYKNSDRSYIIRGTIGAMAGFTTSHLDDGYDVNILPTGQPDNSSQNKFLYGFQVGVILESDYGMSLESGIRYRKGNTLEFVDENDNAAVFSKKTSEYFLGINYLF